MPRPREVNHELIWSAVGVGGLALCWTGAYWRGMVPACPFRAATGMPCPLCGGTRAAIAWSHLDFGHAFAMNPLVGVAATLFSIYWFYAVGALMFRTRRLRIDAFPEGRTGWIVRGALAGVLAFNWIYLIAVGR